MKEKYIKMSWYIDEDGATHYLFMRISLPWFKPLNI